MKNANRYLTICLLMLGLGSFVQANYLQAKAWLAHGLIAYTWQKSEIHSSKPWQWADFYPVAKLNWQNTDRYVLSQASGQALAFGPGHMTESADIDSRRGTIAIAGHNDSHFNFLARVQLGDTISLETRTQGKKHYRIEHIDTVDSRQVRLQLNNHRDQGLLLITCVNESQFDHNTPKRLLVHAKPIKPLHQDVKPRQVQL